MSAQTDMVRAQAQYLQASGDFLVSAAIARRHHSLAAQQEIRNHAEWVRTYFELKDLNKAYYLKEHPPYLERREKRQAQLERAIVDNPQLQLEGDVNGDTLNWLLYRIATTALATEVLDAGPGNDAVLEHPLLPTDIHHIVLTDGARKGGRKLLFRADEGTSLETVWPFALRGPEFEFAREQFENERNNAIREITDHNQLSHASQLGLLRAVDELMFTLQREYPKSRRHASSEAWENYSQANNYLQALALAVKRSIDTADRQAFDGSLRFQGNSVFKLIQHLCRHGLEFGEPEPGDQGVYRKLFLAMRNIYVDTRVPLARQPFE
jgi:hypothetical protein